MLQEAASLLEAAGTKDLAAIPPDLEARTRTFCLKAARQLGLDVIEKGGDALYYLELGAGATVDVLASRTGGEGAVSVDTVLSEVRVTEAANEGGVSVAVDPSHAVRAVHAGQTAALTLAVVLPDGRRVVELEADTPVRVGERVDVLVTADRDGELKTWTAIRGAEVLYLGPEGPLVAMSAAQAAEAVAVQHGGRIWLSRYHED